MQFSRFSAALLAIVFTCGVVCAQRCRAEPQL